MATFEMSRDEEDRLRQLVKGCADAQEAFNTFVAERKIDAVTDSSGHSLLLREAQQALVGSNARFRRLVATMSAIVLELEPDGTIIQVNDATLPVLGYRPAELTTRNWWQTFLPADQRDQLGELMARLAVGDVLNHQIVLNARSGHEVTLEWTTANHYRPGGALLRIVAICHDVTARVAAETALRRSERRLRQLFDSTVAGFILAGPDGQIFEANDTFLRLVGYDREDLESHRVRWDTLTPPEYLAHNRAATQAIGQHGTFPPMEKEYIHKDGHRVPVIVGGARGDPSSTEVMSLVLDNSERAKARAALLASEARFRHLADAMPQIVWSASPDGTVDYYNERWYELTGGTRGTQGEDSWGPLIHPDDLQEVKDTWSAALQSGEPYEVELRLKHRSGGYRWFLTRGLPVRDASGNVVRWFGSSTDVEVMKRMEQSLGQQVSRMTLLSDINRAVAARHDLYSILHVVLRYLENELPVDLGFFYLCDSKAGTVTVAAVGAKARATAGAYAEGAIVSTDETGVARCLTRELAYVPDCSTESGTVHFAERGTRSLVGVPLIVQDIVLGILVVGRRDEDAFPEEDRTFLEMLSVHTALAVHQARLHAELRNAYETLQRTQEQVVQQERLRALGQMASGIAHDFNNALSPILGFSEVLLESKKAFENAELSRRYLTMMNTAARDGARVVSRLKEFYRHREEAEVFEPVNLNNLVDETVLLTEPKWKGQAQALGSSIRVRVGLKKAPVFPASAADLRELLTNLIFNAVDAMPQGGDLVINAYEDREHVVLEVVDTGTGMTEEVQRRCLEPFFTTKGQSGTGLGLAMVYGIVRRHNGTIEIESAPGKGTTFRIRLPIRGIASLPTDSHALPGRTRKRSVLVVDDNEQIREMLMAYLHLDGHGVEVAADGRTGLAKFVSGKFEIVLTDRAMPHMSGDQLATAVKAFAPGAFVVLLTGFGEFMGAAGERPAGVDLILSKPVTLAALREALSKVSRHA